MPTEVWGIVDNKSIILLLGGGHYCSVGNYGYYENLERVSKVSLKIGLLPLDLWDLAVLMLRVVDILSIKIPPLFF